MCRYDGKRLLGLLGSEPLLQATMSYNHFHQITKLHSWSISFSFCLQIIFLWSWLPLPLNVVISAFGLSWLLAVAFCGMSKTKLRKGLHSCIFSNIISLPFLRKSEGHRWLRAWLTEYVHGNGAAYQLGLQSDVSRLRVGCIAWQHLPKTWEPEGMGLACNFFLPWKKAEARGRLFLNGVLAGSLDKTYKNYLRCYSSMLGSSSFLCAGEVGWHISQHVVGISFSISYHTGKVDIFGLPLTLQHMQQVETKLWCIDTAYFLGLALV